MQRSSAGRCCDTPTCVTGTCSSRRSSSSSRQPCSGSASSWKTYDGIQYTVPNALSPGHRRWRSPTSSRRPRASPSPPPPSQPPGWGRHGQLATFFNLAFDLVRCSRSWQRPTDHRSAALWQSSTTGHRPAVQYKRNVAKIQQPLKI